ncbi:MAG: hypothetical protein ACXABO_14735 [Promethearchaeota archaeon]|jgi:nitrogen-specific signal transduction histidine kinase
MEKGKKDKILNMIKDIENKNSDIEKYLSSLSILSRNEMLKEIMKTIIEKNKVLQEIEDSQEPHLHTGVKEEINEKQNIVSGYVSKIQENPAKKIIYLREFLEYLSISNQDKDVILNSLKDEIDNEILKKKMSGLVDIFL